MGAKFCFFTDPARLAAQQPEEAFGAMPPAGGKDRYRVTDLHAGAGIAPAVAICDGLLCAQRDSSGTLSLILKPIEQPPFDFPAIAYFIYKGVDPASLLAGAFVDVSKAADNDLVRQVEAAWLAPVNENSGDPPERCLGLHLAPSSNASDFPDLDLGLYADAQPLDHLFYRGDPDFQLPLVRGGWRLGDFAAAGPFGLEIIADTATYAPRIKLARQVENRIEVPSLDPGVALQPYDAAYFMHWHAKEEALHFLDPCAFWGSFYHSRLRVVNADGSTSRKKGAAVYEEVLRGPYDDSTPAAGLFHNRNRIYLDIRNEHHRSFNYYKTNGDEILVAFAAAAALEDNPQSYNGSGWPIFSFDHSLSAWTGTGSTRMRLAFHAGQFRTLDIYIPPQELRRATSTSARRHIALQAAGAVTPQVRIDLPAIGPEPNRPISRYVGLAVRFDGYAEGADPITPHYPWDPQPGIPLDGFDAVFGATDLTTLKTFADCYLLRLPLAGGVTPCNPAWIRSTGSAVLVLVPSGPLAHEIGPPAPAHSLELPADDIRGAVSRLIRPRLPVFREAGDGRQYFDYEAPLSETQVARAVSEQIILLLSPSAMAAIRDSKTTRTAILNLDARPWEEGANFTFALCGLREDDDLVTTFREPLDMKARSNAYPG